MMFLGDFFAFYTIPMLLNIIIYARIAVTLTKCGEFESDKSKRESRLKTQRDAPYFRWKRATDTGRRQPRQWEEEKRRSQPGTPGHPIPFSLFLQVVKMLALVVIVFATCWLPYRAMVMYNSFAQDKWSPDWYVLLPRPHDHPPPSGTSSSLRR